MKKAPFAGQQRPHHAEFAKLLRGVAYRHEPWRVFADFCEAGATSLHNAVRHDPKREARYLDIVGCYTTEEVAVFPKLFAATVMGLEEMDRDFLGEVFMDLDFANHWHGQFFTPFELCRAIAELTAPMPDDPTLRERGYIRVLEPAVGAGAMVLAFARAMRDRGIDFQHRMHVVAIDVDRTAAMMAYLQFALWHIPALVCIGNALTPDAAYEVWPTPAHYLGFWPARLRVDDAREAVEEAAAQVVEPPPPVDAIEPAPEPAPGPPRSQLTLF